ncbi:hypothetical protein [Myxococcus llanfairpwllgwyngyllgogerychwyrndrobwllllantysiliogogogochensis]|uniref:Nmad2 family putative nucleotide modification protein n=1 Tax=Myxococcus llanfairpwllgwyngyllgogerychwyrndrobwllllantysiliogogogochensis TaxID=2590453 RepID=UPI001C67135B|nr:hypothetical protein [Myxococcus llanfairpwllgwyngyllgogerychwyrndrobwllllantysiliogogogochensis]
MRLYSYVVARDFGFAPNPFFGFCTLATCKPKIRKRASVGDWVIGTGAASTYKYRGRLIYAMQVSEVLDFDKYWNDSRFLVKRPNLTGSLKVMYGDNIYHREGERWVQADSHHSLPGGRVNDANLVPDTGVDRLLVATKFVYWGRSAPELPKRFRSFGKDKDDICAGRYNRVFEGDLPVAFSAWLERENRWGIQGDPLEFARHERAAAASAMNAAVKKKQSARRTAR